MRARAAADQELRAAVVAAHEGDMSTRQIGRVLRVTHTTVQNILREEQQS